MTSSQQPIVNFLLVYDYTRKSLTVCTQQNLTETTPYEFLYNTPVSLIRN